VVHRDVKPSNIMVLPNGRVKLTDFGIAQSTDDPRLTTSGVLIGSPTYLAPEVIRGGQADARSDLWALAASLFYAVEGRAAFDRQSTAATMHAILNEVPYLTRTQGPLAAVITGLLNTKPEARLSTSQVRGLLSQVVHQTMPHAGTALYPANPTRENTGPVKRRNPWPWVAAVVLLVAGAFGGGWFWGRTGLVDPNADSAKGPTYTYGAARADIPEFELGQGGCGAAPLEAGRSYTGTTDCAGPHDFEVIYEFNPFGSDEDTAYPAESALRTLAEASCALVFGLDEAVPANQRDTLVRMSLVPAKESWEAPSSEMNRNMYCLVARKDGKQLTDQVLPKN
jgi:hypothetical protein